MNDFPPPPKRKSTRWVIVLLLMALIIIGTMIGISMGIAIAGGLNRWPTITILIPPNDAQLTETRSAFKAQFLATFYARVTEISLTKGPTRTPDK